LSSSSSSECRSVVRGFVVKGGAIVICGFNNQPPFGHAHGHHGTRRGSQSVPPQAHGKKNS
jgi:hypothetical protein